MGEAASASMLLSRSREIAQSNTITPTMAKLAKTVGHAGMVVSWWRNRSYSSSVAVRAGRKVVSAASALLSKKWIMPRKRAIMAGMNS